MERLPRCFSEAVFSGMGSIVIVVEHPFIDIGLELSEGVIELTPKCVGVECILYGLMKTLANTIGLRRFHLSTCVSWSS